MCRNVNWAHYRISGLRGNAVDLEMRKYPGNILLFIAFGLVAFLIAWFLK